MTNFYPAWDGRSARTVGVIAKQPMLSTGELIPNLFTPATGSGVKNVLHGQDIMSTVTKTVND